MTSNASMPLLPDTASTFAHELNGLMLFLTVSSAAIVLLVLTLVIWFSIRYRRREEDEIPPDLPVNRWLEVSSASAMFAAFLVMFFWGVALYVESRTIPRNAMEIDVVGKQWMWKLQHPGGQREINELHVPLGQPIKLSMISQDVIHSFSVPAFRIKQDVLPGRYTSQWFSATQAGEYHLFCQEYCGTSHSQMIGRVVVMEPKDYQAWLEGLRPDEPPAATGARLFRALGCVQCHGQTAPTLAGLYGSPVALNDGTTVVADEQYLRDSILNPAQQVVAGYARVMPAYRGQLDSEQVAQLIAYIKSLAAAQAPGTDPARTDVAAPATRPTDAINPNQLPDLPPAREPPPAGVKGGLP